jgi:hypothetical protein|tara:strand:+ start:268 stop:783 length:516 start_codon:yes stop_codon:yes gene_type:complete
VEVDKIIDKNPEVFKKLQKSFEMIKYVNPKDPFKVFGDIEKTLSDNINDKTNIDRVYFQPVVQDYLKWTEQNYTLLRSPKKLDRLKVYHFSIKTWVMVLIQIVLFGSILVDRPTKNNDVRIITTPKNYVPLFMKQLDDDGKETGFWELHSLKVIRKFITNIKQQYDKLIRS